MYFVVVRMLKLKVETTGASSNCTNMYAQRLWSARWKVCRFSLNPLIIKKKKTLHVDMPFLIDVRFYLILKPQIGRFWVRHKQLSELASANWLSILLEFWDLKSEILESDKSRKRTIKKWNTCTQSPSSIFPRTMFQCIVLRLACLSILPVRKKMKPLCEFVNKN